MRNKILILILLVGFSTQQCSIGCLKCSTADQCVLCDIVNNYYILGNACALSSQTNCRVLALSGNCVSCNSGFYLDTATQRCLSVEVAKVVANCVFYDSAQACTLCSSGRFLNAGACTASTVLVANCNIYSAEAKCAECNSGHIFKDNLETCAKIPNSLNCLLYTHVNCTQCSSNFVYNRNAVGSTLQTASQGYDLLVRLIRGSTLWGTLNVCQSKASLNCNEQNLFNECISCQPNFFLKNKQCVAFPVEPIFGCAKYQNEVSCSACVEFMYPSNPTTCVNNTQIANCVAYSNDVATNQCKECSRNYYLSANACVLRVNSLAIVDCLTPTIGADTCETCASGAVLTDDKRMCLPGVSNCKAYSPSTLATLFHLCKECNDGYYINVAGNTVTCVKGTVVNCKVYDQGGMVDWANTCVTCNNQFYLSNKLCVAHGKITNCDLYSQSVANRCETCTIGLHPFHMTSVCVATTAILNCQFYSLDGLSCTTCASGFYPAGNTCTLIPATFTNCEQFDGNKCTQCASGFNVDIKNYLGTCYKINFDYLFDEAKAYCFDYATLATNQIAFFNQFNFNTPESNIFYPLHCKSCASGTVPYLPNFNEAICVKESDLIFYSKLSGARSDFCLRYGLSYENKEIVCMECQPAYYIANYHVRGHYGTAFNSVWNTNGIKCQLRTELVPNTGSAVTDTVMVIADDLLGFVNIAVPASTTIGFITNGAAPFKGCTRAVRIQLTQLPTTLSDGILNKNFVCTSATKPTPGTLSSDTNRYYLTVNFNGATNTAYGTLYTDTFRRGASATDIFNAYLNAVTNAEVFADPPVPVNIDSPTIKRFDFNHGYTTTDVGPYPSVFNYKGILHDAEVQNVLDVTNGGFQPAAKIATYTNCEILYRQTAPGTTIMASNAWQDTATVATFYNNYAKDQPATGAVFFCMRCLFGYSLGWATPGANPTRTTNPTFPSCSASVQTGCDSTAVYGGLPNYLNTILNCHKCTVANSFPQVTFETDYTASDTTASSRFIGWDVATAYASVNGLTSGREVASGCVTNALDFNVYQYTSLGNEPAVSKTTWGPGCGVYGFYNPLSALVDTRTTNPAASTQTHRACLACSANYWPVYTIADNTATTLTAAAPGAPGAPGYLVRKCVASVDCDTSVTNQFNGCGRCRVDQEGNPTPVYYAFLDALLAHCVQTPTKNCFLVKNFNGAVDPVTAGTAIKRICGICKTGFFMNADNVCESITIPNMLSTSTKFSSPVFAGLVWNRRKETPALITDNVQADGTAAKFRQAYYVKVHFLLSQQGTPYGVEDCKAGWVKAPSNYNSQGICIYSPFVALKTFGSGTRFISNCVRYKHGDDVLRIHNHNYPSYHTDAVGATHLYHCELCASNYVVASNFQTCVAQGAFTNCLVFNDNPPANCKTCAAGFLNIAGKCVATSTIANCKTTIQTVDYSTTGADLLCSVCNDGFYKTTAEKECLAGNIANCATYETNLPNKCLTCKAGFGLLTYDPSLKYCYPIPSDSNCAQWNNAAHAAGLQYHTFSCARCTSAATNAFGVRSWDYLPTLTAPWKCLGFTLISNCVAYNQNATVVINNDFKCTQCNYTHYLTKDDRECTLRVNNPKECTSTPLKEDKCLTCQTGFYLTADSLKCVINPPGIAGCLLYSDERNCSVCKAGFYLDYLNRCIPALTLVANCNVYGSNGNCTACNVGLFLTNSTTCSTPVASGCLEVLNLNACKTCPAGSGFKTDNGITSCISNALLNCAVSTTVFPFTCTRCNAGWFPSEGTCAAVTATIALCFEYDSATTCKTCLKAGILSVSRTSCDATKYAGLVDANCESNVLNADPSCAQCALGSYFVGNSCVVCPNNGLSFGCLSCDPLAPANCLLCSSGFYMTKSGVCIRNTNLPSGPGTPTVPSPPSTSSVKKVLAFTLGLGALYLEGL